MEIGRAAGLFGKRLHRVNERGRIRHLKALDVVERHVAERALVPIAAARHLDLEPAPRRPEPVHGVLRFGEIHVEGKVESVIGRLHERRNRLRGRTEELEPGPVALVVLHHVEETRNARLVRRTQFRIHIAATQHCADRRIDPLDDLGNAKGAEQCAGEGTRHADDRRLHLGENPFDVRLEDAVDRTPPPQALQDRSEVGHGNAEPFGIAREAEIRIDVVTDPQRQPVDVRGRLNLCLGGKTAVLQNLDRLVRKVVPVRAQHLQRDLDRQIALRAPIPPCGKKPHQRRRGGVGCVQLNKRRCQEQDHQLAGCGGVSGAGAAGAGAGTGSAGGGASSDHSSKRCFCSTGFT